MNFLPLVQHELRLAVRRKLNNHRIRMLCTLAPIVIALWLLLVWSALTPTASFGRQFFQAMALFGYLGSLIAGLVLGADSVSQERREGTLHLLFLTCLRSRDILLGKLTAKMLVSVYALLALLPVLVLSVVLGGITAGQCARLFMIWVNTLFISLSISLFVSSLCRQQRSAQLGAAASLIFLAAVVPLLGVSLSITTENGLWRQLGLGLSPSGLFAVADLNPPATAWFWGDLALNQMVAWAALILADRALRQAQSDPRAEYEQAADSPVAARVSSVALENRRQDRESLLEGRPIEWLACRTSGGLFSRWFWPMIALAVSLCSSLDPLGSGRARVACLLFVLTQTAFKLTVATHATYAFAADRRTGALESLLGTTVNVRDISSGTFRGFAQRFAKPLLLLTALGLLAALRLVWNGADDSALLLAASAVMLLVDVYGGFWVGLFEGLAARNPGLGLLGTVFKILILPAVWFLVAWQIFRQSSIPELVILWFLLAAVNHTIIVVNSRGRLNRYFRLLALKPFGGKVPPLEGDWSPINWEATASGETSS